MMPSKSRSIPAQTAETIAEDPYDSAEDEDYVPGDSLLCALASRSRSIKCFYC